jgi:FkbM family methyltransferase
MAGMIGKDALSTAKQLRELQEEVSRLGERVEHVARVVEASYRENLFWLRKLHAGSAVYLGDHVAMTYLANGCRAYIDTRSRDVGAHLIHGGTWETGSTKAFKNLLRPGARVLDVGANLGWYALVAAPVVGPTGRVFAVEPNPGLARLVHDSLAANGFGGFCRVFQVAVSDAPGVVDLVARPDAPGGGHIRPAAHEVGADPSARPAVRVASVRLDDLLAGEAGPIDVVKMDIEGWEGMAIRGMAGLLDGSPALRMLVEWSAMQDSTPAPRAETAASLSARGYLPFRIAGDGALSAAAWDAVLRDKKLANLVLLKADDPLAAAGPGTPAAAAG